jgi:hypothetical protein
MIVEARAAEYGAFKYRGGCAAAFGTLALVGIVLVALKAVGRIGQPHLGVGITMTAVGAIGAVGCGWGAAASQRRAHPFRIVEDPNQPELAEGRPLSRQQLDNLRRLFLAAVESNPPLRPGQVGLPYVRPEERLFGTEVQRLRAEGYRVPSWRAEWCDPQ